WEGLRDAVRTLLKQTTGPVAPAAIRSAAQLPQSSQPARSWWTTPAGAAAGVGAVLVGLALLVMALGQVGLFGGSTEPTGSAGSAGSTSSPPSTGSPAASDAGSANGSTGATVSSGAGNASAEPTRVDASSTGGAATAAANTDRVNLLDPAEGGMLVIANEDGWRSLIATKPTSTTLSTGGFAVFAFRGEKPVRIDAIGVYVEYTNGRNLKDLLISASDQSETGPFRKIAVISVPNYRYMRGPVHEFALPPFTAKYVKVEIQRWQDEGGYPNGYVGTLQLFGTHQ
ncbi:MAG: hypothetical protein ABL982_23810, partial [Vicinamibacterales bacterium]